MFIYRNTEFQYYHCSWFEARWVLLSCCFGFTSCAYVYIAICYFFCSSSVSAPGLSFVCYLMLFTCSVSYPWLVFWFKSSCVIVPFAKSYHALVSLSPRLSLPCALYFLVSIGISCFCPGFWFMDYPSLLWLPVFDQCYRLWIL